MGGHRRHTESTFRRGAISAFSTTNTESIRKAVEELRAKGEHVIQAAKSALASGVEQLVTDAKSRCPVKTGKLRDSIKAREVEGVESGVLYEISADATNKKGIAYAQFVEFGPHCRPFLYPSLDANRHAIYEEVKNAIKGAIDRGR